MNILAQLFGGNLLEGIKDIIGSLHLDPNKQAEITELLENNKAALAEKQLDMEAKAMDIMNSEVVAASGNIQAEAKSGDKFESRARPMFMYIVEFILCFNFIFVPLVQLCMGKALAPIMLPGDLLTLFGVCVTGYVGARSMEKIMGMDGQSQVTLPFGLGSVQQNSPPKK